MSSKFVFVTRDYGDVRVYALDTIAQIQAIAKALMDEFETNYAHFYTPEDDIYIKIAELAHLISSFEESDDETFKNALRLLRRLQSETFYIFQSSDSDTFESGSGIAEVRSTYE